MFKDYFGELEEESIRDNFVVVYELLDETMDFGYPQTCESKILREYVENCIVCLLYHTSWIRLSNSYHAAHTDPMCCHCQLYSLIITFHCFFTQSGDPGE